MDLARLRELIKAHYGTQTAFAEALGVTKQYVSQIVNGEIEPTLERLVQFSDLLSVTTDELLGKEFALAA
jgi:transcriptional regulator with XRE-family HTH domain